MEACLARRGCGVTLLYPHSRCLAAASEVCTRAGSPPTESPLPQKPAALKECVKAQGAPVAYFVASSALVLHGRDQQAGAAAGLGPCQGLQPPAPRWLAQAHHRSHTLASALEPQDWQVPAKDFHLTRQLHLSAGWLLGRQALKLGASRRAGPPGSSSQGCP